MVWYADVGGEGSFSIGWLYKMMGIHCWEIQLVLRNSYSCYWTFRLITRFVDMFKLFVAVCLVIATATVILVPRAIVMRDWHFWFYWCFDCLLFS